MHQKQRLKNLERFSASDRGLLIASDVAARGLDIPNVQHVIHYQVPKTSESYVHRSGRTARASKEGLSVLFIESSETMTFRKICKTLQRSTLKNRKLMVHYYVMLMRSSQMTTCPCFPSTRAYLPP